MKTYYIYPTAYGLTIEEAPPPFGLQHYQVTATRTFYLGERVASQPVAGEREKGEDDDPNPTASQR